MQGPRLSRFGRRRTRHQSTPGASRDHHDDATTEEPARPAVDVARRVPAASRVRRSAPTAAVPALLVEHVTKRFDVGRKRKPPVLAIDDVSLRLERGEIHGILGRQRLGQVDADPARLGSADPRRGPGRGLRSRHRARRDGGQAADQPGQRGRRLLQEAQPDGEPAASPPGSTASTPRRPARSDGDPGPAGHRREAGRPADRADEPGHAAEGRDRASPADHPVAAAARRADHRPRPSLEARGPEVHRGAPRASTTRRSS